MFVSCNFKTRTYTLYVARGVPNNLRWKFQSGIQKTVIGHHCIAKNLRWDWNETQADGNPFVSAYDGVLRKDNHGFVPPCQCVTRNLRVQWGHSIALMNLLSLEHALSRLRYFYGGGQRITSSSWVVILNNTRCTGDYPLSWRQGGKFQDIREGLVSRHP